MGRDRGYSRPGKGGVDATSRKCCEASFVGADGVVAHEKHHGVSDHPVCAAFVAPRLLLNRAATPPLQGGEYSPDSHASILFIPSMTARLQLALLLNNGLVA